MTEEEMHWIHSNLGPLLATETKLSTKEAYLFATDFVDLLKLKYWNVDNFGDRFDGTQEYLPYVIKVSAEEYGWLEKELAKPAKVNKGLKRLFRNNNG